ncbi:MAG: hypothetical protein GY739_12510 [Mesoflavibacter sp.]|nr:hypothetical protein [Mesoflavibacter sp.]
MNPSELQILLWRWEKLLFGTITTRKIVLNEELGINQFKTKEDYYLYSEIRIKTVKNLQLMLNKLYKIRPWPTLPYKDVKNWLNEIGPLVDDLIDDCKEKFGIETSDYYDGYMLTEAKDNLFPYLYKPNEFK